MGQRRSAMVGEGTGSVGGRGEKTTTQRGQKGTNEEKWLLVAGKRIYGMEGIWRKWALEGNIERTGTVLWAKRQGECA